MLDILIHVIETLNLLLSSDMKCKFSLEENILVIPAC